MTSPTPFPSVAVAICTYRREQVLVETLRQVLAQQPPADEVLVIDQTPAHDADVERYLSEQSGAGTIRWVRQETPNLCVARNRAALESKANVLLYLDDDVLLPPQHIESHRRHYADAQVTAVVHDITVETTKETLGRESGGGSPEHRHEVDYLRGFNFSVRKSAFVQVRGFDESFEGSVYRDEGDFAKRLTAAGLRIFADPAVNVVHLVSPSGGCRIAGNRSHGEWTKSLGFLIYGFRYLRGKELAREIMIALRAGPLRRENVTRPLNWLWAWKHFARACREGWRRGRGPVRSPFVTAKR